MKKRIHLLLPGLLFILLTCFFIPFAGKSQTNSGTVPALPLIIAHRGGAQEFTENTIGAFNRALKLGAEGIETDLRLTRDGELAIYHDEKIGRVEKIDDPQLRLPIADLTFAELTKATLPPVGEDPGGERVPRLDDVLKKTNAGLLNIELKRGVRFEEMVDQTIIALKKYPQLDRVVLEAPDIATATKLRNVIGPQLKLHINPGYDESVSYDSSLRRVLAFKPHSISVSYRKLSWEIVDLAHRAGVQVWVWTVNDETIAQAMMLLGVDAIKTDIPTKLLKLRQQQRK
jgi:glycerophosphoryl diester phosphodiesterase